MDKLNYRRCNTASLQYWFDLLGKLADQNAGYWSSLIFDGPGVLWYSCDQPGDAFKAEYNEADDKIVINPGFAVIPVSYKLRNSDGTESGEEITPNIPVVSDSTQEISGIDSLTDGTYYIVLIATDQAAAPYCQSGCSLPTALRQVTYAKAHLVHENDLSDYVGLVIYKVVIDSSAPSKVSLTDLRTKLKIRDELICTGGIEYLNFVQSSEIISFPARFSRLIYGDTVHNQKDLWYASTRNGVLPVRAYFISEPWGIYGSSGAFFDITYRNAAANPNFSWIGYASLKHFVTLSAGDHAGLSTIYGYGTPFDNPTVTIYKANLTHSKTGIFLPGWIGNSSTGSILTNKWALTLFSDYWFGDSSLGSPYFEDDTHTIGWSIAPGGEDPFAANWVELSPSGTQFSVIWGAPHRLTGKPHYKILYPNFKFKWHSGAMMPTVKWHPTSPKLGLGYLEDVSGFGNDTASGARVRLGYLLDFLGQDFWILDVPYHVTKALDYGTGHFWGWTTDQDFDEVTWTTSEPWGTYNTSLISAGDDLRFSNANYGSLSHIYANGYAWHWENRIVDFDSLYSTDISGDNSTVVQAPYITIAAWVEGVAGQQVEIGFAEVDIRSDGTVIIDKSTSLYATAYLNYTGKQWIWAVFDSTAVAEVAAAFNLAPYLANKDNSRTLRVGAIQVLPGVGPGPLMPTIGAIPEFRAKFDDIKNILGLADEPYGTYFPWPHTQLGTPPSYWQFGGISEIWRNSNNSPNAHWVVYRARDILGTTSPDSFTISLWYIPRLLNYDDDRYFTLWALIGTDAETIDDPCGGPGFGLSVTWYIALVRKSVVSDDTVQEWLYIIHNLDDPTTITEIPMIRVAEYQKPITNETNLSFWFRAHLVTTVWDGKTIKVWLDATNQAEASFEYSLENLNFVTVGGFGLSPSITPITSAHAWIDEVLINTQTAKFNWHLDWLYAPTPFNSQYSTDSGIAISWLPKTSDRIVSTFASWAAAGLSAMSAYLNGDTKSFGYTCLPGNQDGISIEFGANIDITNETLGIPWKVGTTPTYEVGIGPDIMDSSADSNVWNTYIDGIKAPQNPVSLSRGVGLPFAKSSWWPELIADLPLTAIARSGLESYSESISLPYIIFSSQNPRPGGSGDPFDFSIFDTSDYGPLFTFARLDPHKLLSWRSFKSISDIATAKAEIYLHNANITQFTPLSGRHGASFNTGNDTWSQGKLYDDGTKYVWDGPHTPFYAASPGKVGVPTGPAVLWDGTQWILPGFGKYVITVGATNYKAGLGSVGRLEYTDYLMASQTYELTATGSGGNYKVHLLYGGIIIKKAFAINNVSDGAIDTSSYPWISQKGSSLANYWIIANLMYKEDIDTVFGIHIGMEGPGAIAENHIVDQGQLPGRLITAYRLDSDGASDALYQARLDIYGPPAARTSTDFVTWAGQLGETTNIGQVTQLTDPMVNKIRQLPSGTQITRWSFVPTVHIIQLGMMDPGTGEFQFGSESTDPTYIEVFALMPARIRGIPIGMDQVGWDRSRSGKLVNQWSEILLFNENLGNDLHYVDVLSLRVKTYNDYWINAAGSRMTRAATEDRGGGQIGPIGDQGDTTQT